MKDDEVISAPIKFPNDQKTRSQPQDLGFFYNDESRTPGTTCAAIKHHVNDY